MNEIHLRIVGAAAARLFDEVQDAGLGYADCVPVVETMLVGLLNTIGGDGAVNLEESAARMRERIAALNRIAGEG